jgi:hypothetical protein
MLDQRSPEVWFLDDKEGWWPTIILYQSLLEQLEFQREVDTTLLVICTLVWAIVGLERSSFDSEAA